MKKIIYLLTLLISLFLINSCAKRTNNVEELNIQYETIQNLDSYIIVVTPYENLKELTINLKIKDKYNSIIYEDTINKNNLKNGYTYRYEFEYKIIDNLIIENYSYKFSGITYYNKTSQTLLIIGMLSIPLIVIIIANKWDKHEKNKLKE